MLFAAAKACPVFGGTVKSFDFNAIKDRPRGRPVYTPGMETASTPRDIPSVDLAEAGRLSTVLTTTAAESALCTAFCTPLDEIGSIASAASPRRM